MTTIIRFFLTTAFCLATSDFSYAQGKTAASYLPASLETASGKAVSSASLRGKMVAIYFSANWCPSCKVVTPQLKKIRNANASKGFEVVLASLDNSDAEKSAYMKAAGITWPSVRGAKSNAVAGLQRKFGVSQVPAIVVISPNGKIITRRGVNDVLSNPSGAFASWQKKAKSPLKKIFK